MYLWGLPVCWPRGFLSRGQCRQGLVPTRTWAMAQPGPSAPLGRSPCRGSWATADRELVFPSRSGNSGIDYSKSFVCLFVLHSLPSFSGKVPFVKKKKERERAPRAFLQKHFPLILLWARVKEGKKWDEISPSCLFPVITQFLLGVWLCRLPLPRQLSDLVAMGGWECRPRGPSTHAEHLGSVLYTCPAL